MESGTVYRTFRAPHRREGKPDLGAPHAIFSCEFHSRLAKRLVTKVPGE